MVIVGVGEKRHINLSYIYSQLIRILKTDPCLPCIQQISSVPVFYVKSQSMLTGQPFRLFIFNQRRYFHTNPLIHLR